jgi:hypothetical protein
VEHGFALFLCLPANGLRRATHPSANFRVGKKHYLLPVVN